MARRERIAEGSLKALGDYGSRARRKGRARWKTISRALEGDAANFLLVLRLGGRPPDIMLTAEPEKAAASMVHVMARMPTLEEMATVGATCLGIIAHAFRQPGGPQDKLVRQTLATYQTLRAYETLRAYLRNWWNYAARARASAPRTLSDALAAPGNAGALSPAKRAAVFEAFGDLALILCLAPWSARLRLCVGPTCRKLYYVTRGPAGTGTSCSGRCRQAAHRARHVRGARSGKAPRNGSLKSNNS